MDRRGPRGEPAGKPAIAEKMTITVMMASSLTPAPGTLSSFSRTPTTLQLDSRLIRPPGATNVARTVAKVSVVT
jgi:hypothetical protein